MRLVLLLVRSGMPTRHVVQPPFAQSDEFLPERSSFAAASAMKVVITSRAAVLAASASIAEPILVRIPPPTAKPAVAPTASARG